MIKFLKIFILIISTISYGKNTKIFIPEVQSIKKVAPENIISKHIIYPNIIRDYSLSGTSVVEFNIDKYGYIQNIEIVKAIGQPFDIAILNGLQSFTSHEMLKGQFSKELRYSLPIYFKN